jgi:hypothetical protein
MDDRITIIEGPPPVFEKIEDGWALGLNEAPGVYSLALTRLRTFNGPALVERCHRAWNNNSSIKLHYRNDMGLEETAPIMAVRSIDTDEGHMLLLWCRKQGDDLEDDDDLDFDDDDINDDDFDDLDDNEDNDTNLI